MTALVFECLRFLTYKIQAPPGCLEMSVQCHGLRENSMARGCIHIVSSFAFWPSKEEIQ